MIAVLLKKKLRKCSSNIITSILSLISVRHATNSNQIKQRIRNDRSATLQRTFKMSCTSFSHSTRNKTRDGLIRVRNISVLSSRIKHTIFVSDWISVVCFFFFKQKTAYEIGQ